MVDIDASSIVIGAVLLQDGRSIAFKSKNLNRVQQNHLTYKHELFVIVHALK